MQINVSGHQVDVGDALRTHVEERLSATAQKYFGHAVEANVVISREGSGFRADCSFHVGHGIEAKSRADGHDVYGCFDGAADRLEKQLRRYKRRLNDHHHRRQNAEAEPGYMVQDYVLESEAAHDEAPEDFQPVVIAEKTKEIHSMTIGDAVMKLELGDEPMVLFRNSQNGKLNLIHRRDDGHIGWLDLAEDK